MLTIPLTDSLGLKVNLELDDKSDVGRFGLQALESKVNEFAGAAGKPLDQTPFRAGTFGSTFTSPTIAVSPAVGITLKSGVNTAITVFRAADETLFKAGGASPDITIGPAQAWVCFEVDASVSVTAGAASPSGFGVSGKDLQTRGVSSYTLIQAENGKFPTLKESVQRSLSNFRLLRKAADIRAQNVNTVYEWDVTGTFAIRGTYGYPLATNLGSLAGASLPFAPDFHIGPSVEVSLSGSLAVTGEFRGRCYRSSGSKVQLGLYKKRETDLAAEFVADAGVVAGKGSTDLLAKLFGVLPGANFDKAQVPDADREAMQASLKSALGTGFAMAVNGSCSASISDEAAVLYEIDLSGDPRTTDAALDAALDGDWTAIGKLPTARELRNVLTHTHETGWNTSLNLLGIYDCASVADFVRQCTVLHNLDNGEITITDKETAQRISVSSARLTTQDDKLRKVLDQSFLATVAYAAGSSRSGLGPRVQATQSLVVYQARANYGEIRKNLLLGAALQLLTPADLASVVLHKDFKYFRLAVRTTFQGETALRLFFSNVPERIPYAEGDLKRIGRRVLISLLDPGNPVDEARRQALGSDTAWAAMEAQKFPAGSPASYSDWYDIVTWAHSVSTVAPKLKAVLEVSDAETAGDPTKDAKFMSARDTLAKGVAEVTRNTKAAFEKGWPIAVMFTLAGSKAPISMDAQWDGVTRFAKELNKAQTV